MSIRGSLGVWSSFFRLRLLPTAWTNLATGWIAASSVGAERSAESLPLLLPALAAVSALYCFGMGANDWRDRSRDAVGAPHRPIPARLLSEAAARRGLLLSLVAFGSLLPLLPARCALPAGGALLAVLLYDFLVKDRAWLGPLAMGSVRVCVVLLGGTLAGAPEAALLPALLIGGHGLWVTRYSLEEEQARPRVLRCRARLVLLHSVLAAPLALHHDASTFGLPALLGWTLLVGLGVRAERERPSRQPGAFTFASLRRLFLLDGALHLTYNSPHSALLCLVAYLLSAPRSSRRARSRRAEGSPSPGGGSPGSGATAEPSAKEESAG